jgi:hypothetical protein
MAAMRRPARLVLLAASLAALVVGLSACGSSGTPATSTAGDRATTGAETATGATAALDRRLPPETAIPGLSGHDVQHLPTAQELVDALYSEGDTAKPAAVRRYTAAGFRGGVVRDQQGTTSGPTFFRAYVVRLGSGARAMKEVGDSTAEVLSSTGTRSTQFTVPGIPGARGLDISVAAGGRKARILFVTFAGGPYVYGYQAITLAGTKAPRAALLSSAQATYRRWGAAP